MNRMWLSLEELRGAEMSPAFGRPGPRAALLTNVASYPQG